MDPVRLDSKQSLGNGWFGASAEGYMPARTTHAGMSPKTSAGMASEPARVGRVWWRRGLRFVRDAAIGLTLIAAIPLGVIALRGDSVLREGTDLQARLVQVEGLRSMTVAKDAAISPMEAGELLHALNPTKAQKGLPMRAAPTAPTRPWEAANLSVDMFAALRTTDNEGAMAAGIITTASAGFTEQEMTYLRAVAEAPIWRDVERLASAPAVDMIGGRFVLPFRPDALAYSMPVVRFLDTKRMAYAGVSRAAYYMAMGQTARAEAALKTVVSYGFVLVDNGSHMMDAMIGRVMIGIGQNGLHQLYTLIGDRAGMAATVPFANVTEQVRAPVNGERDASAALARLVHRANDRNVPRTIRFETLRQLTFASCGSVRGAVLGPPASVRDAFSQAKRDLARYPSERAYLDLMYSTIDRWPLGMSEGSATDRVIIGAAAVTSTVLGSNRVAACTRVVMMND